MSSLWPTRIQHRGLQIQPSSFPFPLYLGRNSVTETSPVSPVKSFSIFWDEVDSSLGQPEKSGGNNEWLHKPGLCWKRSPQMAQGICILQLAPGFSLSLRGMYPTSHLILGGGLRGVQQGGISHLTVHMVSRKALNTVVATCRSGLTESWVLKARRALSTNKLRVRQRTHQGKHPAIGKEIYS